MNRALKQRVKKQETGEYF